MRAAYDARDDTTKVMIQNLVCEHSQMYSYSMLGGANFFDKKQAETPPVPRRLSIEII
jgi:alpha-ketoglutarate-dependent 2,4-dichlorophenoxyacetate dioxygenase